MKWLRLGDALGAAWLSLLLAGVAVVGGATGARIPPPSAAAASSFAADVGTLDASGHVVPRKAYRRIASASSYADQLLLALAEPERLIALSHYGRAHDPDAFRYGARAQISSPGELERLLALHVDLLLVNHLGAQSELERVRTSGIAVFDLGEMRGLSSLHASVLAIGSVLGERARGERLWKNWSRRLHAVARDVPPSERKRALYVADYAGKLYGGTLGTSYHDVLEAAGLIDLAAQRYRDWPNYDPEELLQLDPPLLVTELGMAAQICGNVWLRALSACAQREHARTIVELDSNLLGNPGLGMLEAAEELHAQLYGSE